MEFGFLANIPIIFQAYTDAVSAKYSIPVEELESLFNELIVDGNKNLESPDNFHIIIENDTYFKLKEIYCTMRDKFSLDAGTISLLTDKPCIVVDSDNYDLLQFLIREKGESKMTVTWTDVTIESDKNVVRKVDKYGVISYKLNGKLHRDGDRPALIDPNYGKSWHTNGNENRGNGKPSAVNSEGHISWSVNGKVHRDGDSFAMIDENGTKMWMKNNLLHRDGDKPAMIFLDGLCRYYKNGKCHRDDGKPAEIKDGKAVAWYCNGKRYYNGDISTIENTVEIDMYSIGHDGEKYDEDED